LAPSAVNNAQQNNEEGFKMTDIATPITPPAWYKQFWPWFLISFPAIAVFAGIATIILAVKSADGLVKDDYYKAGLAINQTLERKQAAKNLNLNASAHWDRLTQTVTLKLTGKLDELPSRLILHLAHITQADHDYTIPLFLAPDKKSYTGRMQTTKKGSWIASLEPSSAVAENNWLINGRVTLPNQNQWEMNSQY